MLDLLLDRVYEAHDMLLQSAEAIPSDLELRRIKLSDQFVDMMYEVIESIANSDGQHVLTERKNDVVVFGELFASVLWHLTCQHEQWQLHCHQLLCERCRQNLRKRRYKFN